MSDQRCSTHKTTMQIYNKQKATSHGTGEQQQNSLPSPLWDKLLWANGISESGWNIDESYILKWWGKIWN